MSLELILKQLLRFLDDILLVAGCICVLYGFSLINTAATWIVAGGMLIGLAYLVGKAKSGNAIN